MPSRASLLLLLVAGSATIFGASPAHASTDDFSYDSFEADIYVVADESGSGQMFVRETWGTRFPDTDRNKGTP